jgi:hypothetical protein
MKSGIRRVVSSDLNADDRGDPGKAKARNPMT